MAIEVRWVHARRKQSKQFEILTKFGLNLAREQIASEKGN